MKLISWYQIIQNLNELLKRIRFVSSNNAKVEKIIANTSKKKLLHKDIKSYIKKVQF